MRTARPYHQHKAYKLLHKRRGKIDWFNFALGWVWACALGATMMLYFAHQHEQATKKNLINPISYFKAERIQRDTTTHYTFGKIEYSKKPVIPQALDNVRAVPGTERTKTDAKQAYTAPQNEITAYIDLVFGQFSNRAKAIIQCESSFNVNATHQNHNGSVDRGLWQINSIHKDITPECAFDFKCATDAAHRLFQAQGFGPWVCNRKV